MTYFDQVEEKAFDVDKNAHGPSNPATPAGTTTTATPSPPIAAHESFSTPLGSTNGLYSSEHGTVSPIVPSYPLDGSGQMIVRYNGYTASDSPDKSLGSFSSRTGVLTKSQTLLEKHKSFAQSHELSRSHTQDASLKRLALDLQYSSCRAIGNETNGSGSLAKTRISTGNLVIGIFKKQHDLSETDLFIDDTNGHLKVIDPEGKLGLGRLPVLSGHLYKHQQAQRFPLFSWNRRFVVLHEGMLYWFHSKSDFITSGAQSSAGAINFVIHKTSVDIVGTNRNHFQIATNGGSQQFTFDCSRSEYDRGVWVVSVLAHINKAEEIRSRFKCVNWAEMENAAFCRHEKFWKSRQSLAKKSRKSMFSIGFGSTYNGLEG